MKFFKLFAAIAKATYVSQHFEKGTGQGPQASKMQYDKFIGYINSASKDGAKLVICGKA